MLRSTRQKLEAGFAHKKCVPIWVKTLRYKLFRPAPAPYAHKLRRGCGCGGAEIRGARLVEYCDQPAKNLKQVLYTRTAYRFGSRPYVTDCPAQRSHHIATIGDKRCVRSRWRCTWALARGIAKLGSCISAAVFMAVRLDMAALAQKLRQRHERGALVIDGTTLLP